MNHPPGAIVIPGGEFLRFSGFMFSLLNMQKPDNSHVLMKQSVSIVENVNYCIRKMPPECEWCWLQADDHIWPADSLITLLDLEVDVVVPLILMRSPPFSTVIFKERTDEGYMPYELHEIPEDEPFQVYAAGGAGMLIRRYVLDAIGDPWMRYDTGKYLNEDLVLSNRIRELGYEMWCHPGVRMGHRATYTVWPTFDEEGWGIGMSMGQDKEDGSPQSLTIRPREKETA